MQRGERECFMRIAVFSDSHGVKEPMLAAIEEQKPDMVLHLGDYVRDTEAIAAYFPSLDLRYVRGNCDAYSHSDAEENLLFNADGVRIFMTHGHRYNVKLGYESLANAAHFSGAQLALFGHTHEADFLRMGDVTLFQPRLGGHGPADLRHDHRERNGVQMRDSLPVNAGRRYFAAADVLRILCIFTVAWFHIWQQSWLDPSFRIAGHYFDLQRIVRRGYMLVDLTLLLTGFLLYRPLVRAEGKIADVKGFYYRRLCRILPCYLLAVLVAAAFALARGRAVGSAPLWRDLLTHLTFTHTFSMDTYYWTSLNAALWTVAVEMQFYLIFPLLARAFGKRPALTFSLMTLAALVSRALVALHAHELSLWLNQLPCMLDLYALGMLAAHLLEKRTDAPRRWVFFPLALLALFGAFAVLWQQNAAGDAEIKMAQLLWRLPLGVCGAAFLYFSGRAPERLDRVFGNRAVRFLSAISYNFYIWHQFLAVKLKEFHIPAYVSEFPQMSEGRAWQTKYTLLCFAAAFLLSAALTYLVEKPAGRALLRLRARKEKV